MNPRDAKTIADFLIGDFENEMQTTLRVIAAVPRNNLDYRPDGKSRTGLGLVRHIVLEDVWMLNSLANGVFTAPPDDSNACGIMKPDDAVAFYKREMPAALDHVRAMSGEQLATVMDMLGFMQMPAVNFVGLAIKHSVHHRGQLSAYLRAMGGSIPGIYGPTADTQLAAAT
jgi:uncharacterized damage-inducible protein DinB